jgi:hypothetical protein
MATPVDRELLLQIARRHGARAVRVFGSYARGQQTAGSDIDLLIDFEPHRDLFDLIELKRELEERFHLKFDVLTENALSPYIREQVLREARPL